MASHAHIKPDGMKEDDIIQLLYEIGYLLENTMPGAEEATYANFTITCVNRKGDMVGAADYKKVLKPNGFNWAYAVQYLYEIVYYLINKPVTGAAETAFTGQIANLYHTMTGGSTTRNWFMYPNGVSQGLFCTALYQVVNHLIDDIAGPAKTDFTLDVMDETGNIAGVSG